MLNHKIFIPRRVMKNRSDSTFGLFDLPKDVILLLSDFLSPRDFLFLLITSKQGEKLIGDYKKIKNRSLEKDPLQFISSHSIHDILPAIDYFRTTAHYQLLKNKILSNEKVPAQDFILYAFLTDDIKQLDPTLFESAIGDCKDQLTENMHENLNCMLTALKNYKERDPDKQEIRKKFENRTNSDFVNLSGIELPNRFLVWGYFAGSNFSHADLRSVSISGQTNFSYCNLTFAKLIKADCSFTDFSYSLFKNSICTSALFYKGNLQYVNFEKANLSNASFNEADLTGAYLYKAIISGADFEKAKLENTQFLSRYLYQESNPVEKLTSDLNFLNVQIRDNKSVHALRDAIAKNIIQQANQFKTPEEKISFVTAACNHPIFEHRKAKSIKDTVNKATLATFNTLWFKSDSKGMLLNYLEKLPKSPLKEVKSPPRKE